MGHLDYLLDDLPDGDELLYHDFDGNCNFPRDNLDFLDYHRLDLLVVGRDDFIDAYRFRNFSDDLNHIINLDLVGDYSLGKVIYRDEFIDYSIHWFLYFDVHILDDLYFYDFLLDYGNLNYPFDISNDNFFDLLLNYLLNYLRDLDYSFNDSRYYDYLLDYSLDLNDFGYFHQFLHDPIHLDSDLFDSLDVSWDLYYFLLDVSHNLRHLNNMIYYSLHLNDLWLVNDHRLPDVYLLYNRRLDSLYHRLLYDLLDPLYYLMNDRHLNDLLDFKGNLLDNLNDFLDNDLDRLDDLFPDQLLSDDFDLLNLDSFDDYLHYFLNDGGDFYDSLYDSFNGDDFLNNSVDRLMYSFDVVVDLEDLSVLDYGDSFLYNFLNNFNPDNFDYSLHYFLLDYRDLYDLLDYGFNWNYLLFDNFDLLRLLQDVVDYSFELDYLLHFYDFLNVFYHLDDAGHFLNNLNDPLDDCWHLNHPLDNLLNRHDLFNDLSLNHRNLNRHVNKSVHLNYSFHLHYLLHLLRYRDQHRHLYSFLNDFLHDLLNLNYLRHGSEHF